METLAVDPPIRADEKLHDGSAGSTTSLEYVAVDPKAERRLLRKLDLHIVPILALLFLFAFLDRTNIGNANIQGLQKELKMKGNDYSIALLIYFVPYCLFEIPSNLLIKKMAPSTFLSASMFLWGIATMCQGLVHNQGGLVACRFFSGFFEAGFVPGVFYVMSMYYKRYELQRRFTTFFAAGILAGAFSGLLAYALAKMNGIGGLSGWRWIFVIEGLATIVLAALGKFIIVDWPEDSKLLNREEKALLFKRLADDGHFARMDRLDRIAFFRSFFDWKVWVAAFMYFGVVVTGYSTSYFTPTILAELGWTSTKAQVYSIPIYIFAAVAALLTAWLTDKLHHRFGFIVFGNMVAAIGYIILLCQGPAKTGLTAGVKYMAVYFITVGVYIAFPVTLVWLGNNLSGHYKRAIGSAIQIGFGNMGGFVAVNVWFTKQAPRYTTGYSIGLGFVLLSALMAICMYIGLKAENRRRDLGKRDSRLQDPDLGNMGDDHPHFRYSM
ncbi:MAG: hypothetical protein M1827_004016 [Pycnora praestabilis]|nr:MAG: hypothetical protein M1827_004016 [Pycnora praestabilis]